MRFESFSATARCPKSYPYHMTTSLLPQKASVASASRLSIRSSSASPRPHRCYTCRLRASRFSIAPSPNSCGRISSHQKGATSRQRNYDHAIATMIEKYALTAINVYQSQHIPVFPMLGAFSSPHTSSPSPEAELKTPATHVQAVTRHSMTRMLSWITSFKSRSVVTGVACEPRARTLISSSTRR